MRRKQEIKIIIVTGIISAAITAAVMTALFVWSFGGPRMISEVSKYAAVSRIVSERYIGQADMAEVSDAGYRAMIGTLGDRWSYYMTAEEYAAYESYSENTYVGIGVTITQDTESGGQRVVSVGEDSPAARAGIVPDDVIVALDGEDIRGRTSAEVRTMILRNSNIEVGLELIAADGSIRVVTVSRETIFTSPVTHELLESNVGYVKLRNFESGSADGFIEAVDALIESGARGLVFDVRRNPGGKVTELMRILDHLLPEGDIFVRLDRDGNETVNTSDPGCVELPMAVMVDKDSYSAAEFFAAALSEYGRAVIVGEPTTGKGRAQVTYTLRDGSAVHISNSVYLTPVNRKDLSEEGGLQPDVRKILDDQSRQMLNTGLLEKADDEQLIAAISALDGTRELGFGSG